MKRIYLVLIPLAALLFSCESDTPAPAVKLTVGGLHMRDVVLQDKDIPVVFDVIADRPVNEDTHILLSVNGETTAKLNKHFRIEKSTLWIGKGNSKTYGKLIILQENFADGDAQKIRIDMSSSDAVFADTSYIVCNITMGAIRSPRPEYCLPESNWGMYAGINGFEFAGINNAVLTADAADYYGNSAVVNYSDIRGEAVKGETYSYKLTPDWWKTGDGDIYEVVFFIDWNRDGRFDGKDELILRRDMDKAAAANPLTGEITIPADASVGLTGIRVGFFAKPDTDIDNGGCGYIDSGEFEDYTLFISDPE